MYFYNFWWPVSGSYFNHVELYIIGLIGMYVSRQIRFTLYLWYVCIVFKLQIMTLVLIVKINFNFNVLGKSIFWKSKQMLKFLKTNSKWPITVNKGKVRSPSVKNSCYYVSGKLKMCGTYDKLFSICKVSIILQDCQTILQISK